MTTAGAGGNVDQNKNVQVNWGTFNIPTIAAVFGMGMAILSITGTQSAKQERVDARLDQIESDRTAKALTTNERLKAVELVVQKIPNLEYRITVNEQAIVAVNARQDRFADAVGDLRDALANIKTSIEVLTERLPDKKAELETLPNEYVGMNK